jgi:hypothetical protein
MLHRFGVWKWALGGWLKDDKDSSDVDLDDHLNGLHMFLESLHDGIEGEIDDHDDRDMFDEFLCFLVVFLSELPRPQGGVEGECKEEEEEEKEREETKEERVKKSLTKVLNSVKSKMRREVVHRLAVGPQTHSALREVYGLLSPREMKVVKHIGGDDGELLEDVLKEVAVNQIGQGLSPNTWHLKPAGWDEYDPCFYHLNEKGHQMAAANRTEKWGGNGEAKGGNCKPLGKVADGWGDFRKCVFWEDTVRAIVWGTVADNMGDGKGAAERQSETGLARVVQLLTLGLGVMEQEGGDEKERWEEVSRLRRQRGTITRIVRASHSLTNIHRFSHALRSGCSGLMELSAPEGVALGAEVYLTCLRMPKMSTTL